MVTDLALTKIIKRLFNYNLFGYQVRFVFDCLDKQRVVGVFCRQTGKSLCLSFVSIIEALSNPGENVLIIAPTDQQAGELFEKIANNLKNSELITCVESITKRSALFKNGARIIAKTTGDNGTNIRGMTAKVIILEEAAFIKDSIVHEVIMPMGAATNAKVIKISTPFGMNHFYESAMSSQWILHQYDYTYALKAGLHTESFIKEQQANLTDLQFRTEYNAEFIADQDAYFKIDTLQAAVQEMPELDEPRHHKNEYYLGVDFARMGQDNSVFIIVEKDWITGMLKVVKMVETKHKLLTDAIGRVKILDRIFKFKKINLDESGVGAGPTDVLKEKLGTRIMGVTFTVKSKQHIYSNLKVLLQDGKVKIPNHKKLIYQMRDLRYQTMSSGDPKIHHSERGHDDYPDALALAVYDFKPRQSWKPSIFIPSRRL